MKRTMALIVATLFVAAQLAWAQDKPAPEAAKEAPKPAPEAKAPAKAAHVKKTSKRNEDARRCLELEGNTAIIKCAEEYL